MAQSDSATAVRKLVRTTVNLVIMANAPLSLSPSDRAADITATRVDIGLPCPGARKDDGAWLCSSELKWSSQRTAFQPPAGHLAPARKIRRQAELRSYSHTH